MFDSSKTPDGTSLQIGLVPELFRSTETMIDPPGPLSVIMIPDPAVRTRSFGNPGSVLTVIYDADKDAFDVEPLEMT